MRWILVLLLCLASPAWAGNGSLIARQIFAAGSSGTFTPNANTQSVVVTMCGGGGGSSSFAATDGTHMSLPGAGAGGGCLIKWVGTRSLFNGATYSVGAGGQGGSSGSQQNGGAGNNSTFTLTNATVLTASGGGGGGCACNLASGPNLVGTYAGGGTATNGDVNVQGGGANGGGFGTNANSLRGKGQAAGGSMLAPSVPGGYCLVNQSQAGVNAVGYGGGAASGCAAESSATQAGGNGSDGILIVDEFR